MRPSSPSFVVLLTLAGCVTGEQGETSATAGPPSTKPMTTGEATSTTTGTDTATTAPEQPTTTGEVAGECSVWAQDCPPEAKCVPFDSMNTGVVDAARCVEIAVPAQQAGDPCEAEGGVVGLDDCDAELLCWLLNDDGQGVCTPLCDGTPESPSCGAGLVCDVSNGGLLPLCLTTCDPLAKSCETGQICIPSMAGEFVCDGDVSGDEGAYGDPCAYLNVCDPGLLCVSSVYVPGCDSQGCCTEFCDVNLPGDLCSGAPEQECLPYYDPGAAPPGLEAVGLCGIKQ